MLDLLNHWQTNFRKIIMKQYKLHHEALLGLPKKDIITYNNFHNIFQHS